MGQEDDRVYVRSFDVGLGRDNRTPEGKFQVSSRVENPQHTDPETGKIFDKDDPLNPVGEHWIAIKGTEPATEKLIGLWPAWHHRGELDWPIRIARMCTNASR